MSLDTVICGNVSTSLCAKYCCIREHSPAIDTVGISIDSRLIGDCSCLRYLYFDQHPHILKRRIKTESFVYDIAIVVVVVFVFFQKLRSALLQLCRSSRYWTTLKQSLHFQNSRGSCQRPWSSLNNIELICHISGPQIVFNRHCLWSP